MSTRSITQFLGFNGNVQAIIYRHGDGYPEGAGRDINTFLKACKRLNDPRLDDAPFLAAKYVVYLADMFNHGFEFQGTGESRKLVKVQYESRLEFTSVGIVDATFDDYAYRYTVNCEKLDAKGLPEVTCYDSENKIVPIPKGKNKWS